MRSLFPASGEDDYEDRCALHHWRGALDRGDYLTDMPRVSWGGLKLALAMF
jgi:hypothetical protein